MKTEDSDNGNAAGAHAFVEHNNIAKNIKVANAAVSEQGPPNNENKILCVKAVEPRTVTKAMLRCQSRTTQPRKQDSGDREITH
jgi:hypothetical protein